MVSDSPGLVDPLAVRLAMFLLNLPDGQVILFGEIQISRTYCNQSCSSNIFSG